METFFALLTMLFMQLFATDMAQPASDETGSTSATVLSVIDGDTIQVEIEGVKETVRYIGIDTPEPYRDGEPACYSKQATDRNRALVEGEVVLLVKDVEDRDRFDRLLRYVYVNDVFVNELLITEGYATTLTVEPNTKYYEVFQAAESQAKGNWIGLWESCG